MGFLSSVDLPVSVETAGVGQQFPALLALYTGLTIGSDFTSLGEVVQVKYIEKNNVWNSEQYLQKKYKLSTMKL